jgi:hypothetical protein
LHRLFVPSFFAVAAGLGDAAVVVLSAAAVPATPSRAATAREMTTVFLGRMMCSFL